jgi:ribosome biogenesis GTPase
LAPSDPADTILGRVLKYHSNFYYVQHDGTVYQCSVKGLLKKEGTDILVGDMVTLDNLDPVILSARITQVQPRQLSLSRPKIANIDCVVIVHPLTDPPFSPTQLDRFLTHTLLAGLTPVLCVSKCDLPPDEWTLEAIEALYGEKLGIAVQPTSVHRPETCQALLDAITDKVSVLAGLSGAGKSSLLNCLNPVLQLKVQEVSEKIARGQHTTRHVELLEMAPNTYLADTPGFSNLKFNTVMPEAVEQAFPEFAPYRDQCEFDDCLHRDEPGCAVRAHLGDIPESRYASYLEFLAEAQEYRQLVKNTSQKTEYGVKTLNKKGKENLQIVKLKEKAREASRRTHKQALTQFDHTEDAEEAGDFDIEDQDAPETE